MFNGSLYCSTHVWTQRKNKIVGQHNQDVEKSDNLLGKPSKYVLNLNLNQFSRGQKSNQSILCMFIGSFYCYTNIWTQRKNKIGGQHTQDVEKSDDLLGKHQFSKYYQCQSYWKNCSTPVFWGFSHYTCVIFCQKSIEGFLLIVIILRCITCL